jgi:uridine kinase
MTDLVRVAEMILARRPDVPAGQSLLAAVSGIDGSGKGYVTGQLVAELCRQGVHAVAVNVDGWLALPSRRFSRDRPAENFYRHAIRFEEMFAQLIDPLRRQRSIRIEADFTEETASSYRRHTYDYQDVDVIVLEGIYLLKHAYVPRYDWTLWVDCSFATALERAVRRGQEGLPPEDTIRAYQTIYFPAQEIHFRLDDPRADADAVWVNDPRLGPEGLGQMVYPH